MLHSRSGAIRATLVSDVEDRREMPMVSENEAVVRRFITELWSDGDLDIAEEVVAGGHVHHVGDDVLRGPEEVKRAVVGLRAAFPDLNFEIDDLVSDGDRVV
jgi:predicted ester cyclase